MWEPGPIQTGSLADAPGPRLDQATIALLVRETLKGLKADPETVRRCLAVFLREAAAMEPRGTGLLPWQIERVRRYIDGALNGRISLAGAAEQARLGPSHFSRCFRQCFGAPFSKVVAHRRIEHAQRLMATSPLSLCHIALACGFADQPHFTRTFNALTGTTPARWRRRSIGEAVFLPHERISPDAPVARLNPMS
jgi:AraC-like DNA-binding protein